MARELLDRVCARVGVHGDAPFTNQQPYLRPINSADNAADSARHPSAVNTRMAPHTPSRRLWSCDAAFFFRDFFNHTRSVAASLCPRQKILMNHEPCAARTASVAHNPPLDKQASWHQCLTECQRVEQLVSTECAQRFKKKRRAQLIVNAIISQSVAFG